MDILRIGAVWTGFPGAPGYSNFHFTIDGGFWDGGIIGDETQTAANNAADDVLQAFTAMRSSLPSDVTVSIQPEAEILDSDTGEIQGFVEVEDNSISGSGAGSGWSGASGGVINWRTNDYRFGRRIRGRTFLVPLDGSAYENDGTLSTDGRSDLRSFAARLVDNGSAADLGVWSRPRDGAGGVFATVTNYNVPDLAAILRSRRD